MINFATLVINDPALQAMIAAAIQAPPPGFGHLNNTAN